MAPDEITLPAPPLGVIESLASGFETVATRLILLLLPLLLDLVLWLGPRISFRQAIESYAQELQALIPEFEEYGPEYETALLQLADFWRETAQVLPNQYLTLLVMPSLLAGREANPLPFDYDPAVWQAQTLGGVVGINVLFLGIGYVLWGIYLGIVAQQVRDGQVQLKWQIRRVPLILIQVALLTLVVIVILFAGALVLSTLMLFSPGLMAAFAGDSTLVGNILNIGVFLVFILILWVGMFLIFTIHGMFLNERHLPGAIWESIQVVQWNMPSTFILVVLMIVINVATRYIWELAETGSWLTLAAIAGHAFITTGLMAASFIFFKDRYRYWRELRDELLAELERRRAQETRNRAS